jgi:hypothetical protein
MRQAITTKYLGPTNHRGARVVAKSQAGRMTIHWDHALDAVDNHRNAARALAEHYGWTDHGKWVAGASYDTGYVFVCDDGQTGGL